MGYQGEWSPLLMLIGYIRSPGLNWLHAFFASTVIYMHLDIDYASTKTSNTGGSEVRPNITISVVGLTLDGAFWFHGWTIRMQLIHLKSHFLSSIDSGWMTLQAWTKAYCGICSFLGFNMNSSVNCWNNAFYTLSIFFSIFCVFLKHSLFSYP